MVILPNRRKAFRSQGVIGSVDLVNFLSTYPGAVAAHSLVALAPQYLDSSPVVRVRRSSDNTEQDFTANQVTDGTLLSFCGSGNGFVRTLYDQTGNGRNAIQSTLSLQRRVVISGVLQTKNSNNLPAWAGISGEYEQYTYDSSSSSATFFGVLFPAVGENSWVALSANANATILLAQQGVSGSDGKGLRVGSLIEIYRNGVLQSITSRSDAYNSFLPNRGHLLSATKVDMTDSLWNSSKALAGYPSGTVVSMAGSLQFMILYDSDKSSDRESIEATLNNAFGIYA